MERKTEERDAMVLLVAGEVRLGRPRARGAGLALWLVGRIDGEKWLALVDSG